MNVRIRCFNLKHTFRIRLDKFYEIIKEFERVGSLDIPGLQWFGMSPEKFIEKVAKMATNDNTVSMTFLLQCFDEHNSLSFYHDEYRGKDGIFFNFNKGPRFFTAYRKLTNILIDRILKSPEVIRGFEATVDFEETHYNELYCPSEHLKQLLKKIGAKSSANLMLRNSTRFRISLYENMIYLGTTDNELYIVRSEKLGETVFRGVLKNLTSIILKI